MRAGRPAWASPSDAQLLSLRLSDLGIRGPGPFVEGCVDQVFRELADRGLRLRPSVWVSDEWFSPDGRNGLAVPFYLTHPRLIRLERRMMYGAEGSSRAECLRLLRHEVGHAVQHAYGLQRRRRWRQLFGRSSQPYPTRYRPDPSSMQYVHHLRDWYAQCHPDEDFAETFAVWLRPRSGWRRRYADWPALAKLEYVADLMAELAGRPVPRGRRAAVDPIHRLDTTLEEHYRERRQRFGMLRPHRLDEVLRRLLRADRSRRRAVTLLRALRASVLRAVPHATPVARYALEMIYADLEGRAAALDLRTARAESAVRRELVRFLGPYHRAVLEDSSLREWIPL